MMKMNKNKISPHPTKPRMMRAGCAVLALIMLIACNGSGGGGDLMAGGGIGGTGISIGTISGFGSVIVNDVEYDTEKAKVIINSTSIGTGDTTVRNALAVGMVVRVEGNYHNDGTASAERIIFSSNIRGPVQSITPIDSVVKILIIMGQSVIVDDQTQFENTVFDLLAENMVIEVSGWPDDSGAIRATFIRKISETLQSGTEILIKGNVTETNIGQQSFRINQLVVDISEITSPMPAVGQLAIVKGILDDNGILVATMLSIEDELGVEDADSVELEGIVSQVSSPTDFILGKTAVQTDEATSFKGLEPDDIFQGVRLLIKGSLTNRRLLADEVIAKDKVNIEGQVAEVIGNQITIEGLDGLAISVSELTRVFGDASDINSIETGFNVKILGYAVPNNGIEATQIKAKDAKKDKVKLQGPVTGIDQPWVTVYLVEINTNGIPEDGFEIDSAGAVSRTDFFESVLTGDTVSVMGKLSGKSVKWNVIELVRE